MAADASGTPRESSQLIRALQQEPFGRGAEEPRREAPLEGAQALTPEGEEGERTHTFQNTSTKCCDNLHTCKTNQIVGGYRNSPERTAREE